MTKHKKNRRLVCRLVKRFILGTSFLPMAAMAQIGATQEADEETRDMASPGEIIVTAQRRSERLQDVPIALSAISEEALANAGVASAEDLQGVVPGLTITGFAGVNSSNLVAIRGIAGQPVPIGASQATAVYLDGVFLAKPDAAFFALEDVERVEVLRGPQGTLYGRNATAGAINIITHSPGQTFEGKLVASYGNYNSFNAGGYVSGPLSGDLSGSISGSVSSNDGYFRNSVTGNRIGDASAFTGRARLRYDNGTFDADLSADYTKRKSEDLFTPITLVNGKRRFLTKVFSTNIEDDIGTTLENGGVALTMNFSVSDDITLTSITSYRKFDFFTKYDIDGTDANLIQPIFTNGIDTFNQELRAVYDGDRLRFTIGANYYQEDGEVLLRVNPPEFTKAALEADPRPDSKNNLKALAGFGQFEFDLLDRLTLVAGARLNYETRDFSIDYSTVGAPGEFPPITGNVNDTAFLPSAGVNFEPADDVLLYAKVSRGYQSPGFAYQPGAGGLLNTFGAETLWAYEIGAKTQFWDRRITFNTAAFYYDYTDIQLRRLISSLVSRIENVGAARVKGVEAELVIAPVRDLTLRAQATYLDAEYTDFCEGITSGTPQNNDPLCTGTAVPTADRSGNALNQAPRWSGGGSITYETDVSDSMRLNLAVNYNFETNSYFTAANEQQVSTGGWHSLGARVGLQFNNGFEAFAYGRNITDDRRTVMAFRFGGLVTGVVNDPATYGAGIRYRF